MHKVSSSIQNLFKSKDKLFDSSIYIQLTRIKFSRSTNAAAQCFLLMNLYIAVLQSL